MIQIIGIIVNFTKIFFLVMESMHILPTYEQILTMTKVVA
jgi:hypothetical protein